MAHEVWVRLSPPWMPRPVRQPAFTLKVLEALTPQGTRDVIDSERYELLGDGVLKGMAARHVFQAGRGDEGQMSLALCRLVSNGTLHRVAVVRLCCLICCCCELSVSYGCFAVVLYAPACT